MNSLKFYVFFILAVPIIAVQLISDVLLISHDSFGKYEKNEGLTQSDSLAKSELIETIRIATETFRDPQNARDAGYRPMGPDMPNMGMHWINTGLAVQRTIDIKKPSTLTYLPVDGKLKLTGVAYTTPVKAGEKPPVLPIEIMKWHFHSGNLEKEAHGVHNGHMQQDPEIEMNLAMVHAWVWSVNPDGLFSADNWGLSFERFGLKPPRDINPSVSKALFLASGNVDYYLRFIELSIEPIIIDEKEIRPIFLEYSSKVSEILMSGEINNTLSVKNQNYIFALWQEMWGQIEKELSPIEWKKIKVNLDGHEH